MIIIRYKDAGLLSSILSIKDNNLHFANMIFAAKTVDIIYFEDNLTVKTLQSKNLGQTYKLIGELERKNLSFILLIDRKCDIYNLKGQHLTIVNADCIKYQSLTNIFEDTTETNKSTLFNIIFQEYLEVNSEKSIATNFSNFVHEAIGENLIPDSLLFILISKTGIIHNANEGPGKFYDRGKIWYFNEIYKVIKPKQNSLEEFSSLFESGQYLHSYELIKYTEPELTEILIKYPKLFSDLILKGVSYYDPKEYDDIRFYLEEFDIEDDIEEYYEEAAEAPRGFKLCFSCEEYVDSYNIDKIPVEGKMVDICHVCVKGIDECE